MSWSLENVDSYAKLHVMNIEAWMELIIGGNAQTWHIFSINE